ncbi:hypothetical protein Leryth_026058 [Lithospermum erythrorhizon]|nr:hypothetical protein Leryth_026058 [Lithospermum erythrorhizon]
MRQPQRTSAAIEFGSLLTDITWLQGLLSLLEMPKSQTISYVTLCTNYIMEKNKSRLIRKCNILRILFIRDLFQYTPPKRYKRWG